VGTQLSEFQPNPIEERLLGDNKQDLSAAAAELGAMWVPGRVIEVDVENLAFAQAHSAFYSAQPPLCKPW
jgi:hypothetical protein